MNMDSQHTNSDDKPALSRYKLWHLLRVSRTLAVEMRNRELKDLGITRCQSILFYAMRSAGENATLAELARWTGQKPHGLSALVSRLEAQGYVRRVRDLERKNLVRVELTDKGRVAYEAARQRDSIHAFFSVLTDEQRQCLGEALDALIRGAARDLQVKEPPCTSAD